MEDKEERIKIDYFKEDPCNNCSQTLCQRLIDTCCRLKTDYEENSIAKQEAIEVMAQAIFEDMLKGHNLTWEDADISAKKPFINQAETALNALLGVEK